jgi:hypothetical protein
MKRILDFGFWILVGLTMVVGCTEIDVEEPPVEDEVLPVVTITGDHGLEVGAFLELTAATAEGTDASYTWITSNDGIATVDEAGVVTGVAAGEASVSATGDDTAATGEHAVVVIALPDEAEPVVVVVGNLVVRVDETVTMVAETVGGVDSGYTWTTGDDTIASVDDGEVSGVGGGEVVITATGDDTGVSGVHAVVVTTIPVTETPFQEAWEGSPHADATAEAFTHWDEDGVIEADCAKCHSTPGFHDFLGEDGTDAGSVENDAALGTVIECQACHNASAIALDAVTFPSGVEMTGFGSEARCMQCHQGRSAADTVDTAIVDAAVADMDTPDEDLSFVNIHYAAAGATWHGGLVRGGYQYADQAYDTRFEHTPGHRVCFDCHDQHSLAVRVEQCAECHVDVAGVEDTHDIRMASSMAQDYDGDGDVTEGLYHEIQTLRETLLDLIVAYPVDLGQDPICYDDHAYPYFFIDTDGSGECETAEADYGNQYASWTGRLLQACYNYQYAGKDPGGFAHNGKYVIQLLSDSIADLNEVVGQPVDTEDAVRDDVGHFHGSGYAFRYFDEAGSVGADCSRCHAGQDGLHFYLDHGVGADAEVANGLECATCHTSVEPAELVEVDSVLYPSGIEITDTGEPSNLCATCHSGRESKATVDAAIAGGTYTFLNVHYMPAAAVQQGSEAEVGYEYDGLTYAGRFAHPEATGCGYCHDAAATEHTFDPGHDLTACQDCHIGATAVTELRLDSDTTDWDGDGDPAEPLADEIATVAEALLAEVQLAAVASGGEPLCYDAHAYPYFFVDSDGSGDCDAGEAIYPNLYADWTPALMKAAFNYQLSQKEAAAWAHNFDYMLQLLVDSVDDLGGDVGGYTRP